MNQAQKAAKRSRACTCAHQQVSRGNLHNIIIIHTLKRRYHSALCRFSQLSFQWDRLWMKSRCSYGSRGRATPPKDLPLHSCAFFPDKSQQFAAYERILDYVFFVRIRGTLHIIKFLRIIFVSVIFETAEELSPNSLANRASFLAHFTLGSVIGLPLANRLGVGAEISASPFCTGSPAILHRVWSKIGTTHGKPGCEAGARRATDTCWAHRVSGPLSLTGIRTVFPCACFIDCYVASLEWLIV